jgi:hypothetical protein
MSTHQKRWCGYLGVGQFIRPLMILLTYGILLILAINPLTLEATFVKI